MAQRLRREPGNQPNSFFFHISDGRHYHKNNSKNGTVYFKCVRYEQGCCGRALYSREQGFLHTKPHDDDCKEDMDYPLVMKLRRKILRRCRNLEFVSYRRIISEETRGQPPRVKRQLRLAKMRSAMQRVRQSMYPRVPETLVGLTRILQNPRYRVIAATVDATDSLYAASVTDRNGHHHIIFSSRRMLRFAKQFTLLFSDGTFKTLPAIDELDDASQIFVIVANWNHTIVPIAWVLMTNRTQDAYESVLEVFRGLIGGAPNLEKVIIDFERGLKNAWESVFPGISVQGCFFHIVRAYIRYAKEQLHMTALLRQEPFKFLVKLCCALPLLPANYIRRGFQLIMRETLQRGMRVYRRMRDFFAYVLRNWVNNPVKRRWMCVFGSFHRTNNTCECHNRMLLNYIGTVHPNIYNFIAALSLLEENAYADADALERGGRPGRRRKLKAIRNDFDLRNLASDLRNPPGNLDDAIMRYLRGAVHTFDRAYENAVDEA